MSTRRGVLTALVAAPLVGVGAEVLAPTVAMADAEPDAVTGWTMAPRQAGPLVDEHQIFTNVRGATVHRGFTRVTFDTASWRNSGPVGYFVQYVAALYTDGQGDPVTLKGAGKLQVIIQARAYNQAGEPTYWVPVGGRIEGLKRTPIVVDGAYAGSFEGQSTFGLGLDKKRPFRVGRLADGRVYVDIKH